MRNWLRERRLKMLMTEKEVAHGAEISQPSYHRIETGESNPSVPTAKKIAAVLMFDWTLFFDEKAG